MLPVATDFEEKPRFYAGFRDETKWDETTEWRTSCPPFFVPRAKGPPTGRAGRPGHGRGLDLRLNALPSSPPLFSFPPADAGNGRDEDWRAKTCQDWQSDP